MAASIFALPLQSGRADEFRDLVDELMSSRRIEWAQSQRRRGVTRQVLTLAEDGDRTLALVYVEGTDPEGALAGVLDSDDEFDMWLAGRLRELTGDRIPTETIADTAPKPGPWRGWRRSQR